MFILINPPMLITVYKQFNLYTNTFLLESKIESDSITKENYAFYTPPSEKGVMNK